MTNWPSRDTNGSVDDESIEQLQAECKAAHVLPKKNIYPITWRHDSFMRGDRAILNVEEVRIQSAAFAVRSPTFDKRIELSLWDQYHRLTSGRRHDLVKTGENQYSLPAML